MEDRKREKESFERTKKKKMGLMALLAVGVISGLIYINAYRPFTSKLAIRDKLAFYIERVDQGYGTYAEKFYQNLDTYSLKFNEVEIARLQERMHRELDENFVELITKLEAGEIRFYDDAQEWASYFPNQEERDVREQIADNAFSKGMGKTIDEKLNTAFESAESLFQRILDFFKDD